MVILAGGLGTRLTEETQVKPKPMIEIGGRPMLWHIMQHYAHYGFNEFVVALGYKGEQIKRYFLDYKLLASNLTLNLATGETATHGANACDWLVHLIDTGNETMTGGRVRRLASMLSGTFLLTYGDGVCNVDLDALLRFHHQHERLATITAVRPPARFGGLVFAGDLVTDFKEKPQIGEGWINGGFMVLEPGIFDYLKSDASSLEADALEQLATDGQLVAYRHEQFWQCMDTLRDVRVLEGLWQGGHPPWLMQGQS